LVVYCANPRVPVFSGAAPCSRIFPVLLFEVVASVATHQAGRIRFFQNFDSLNFDELWLFTVDTGDGLTAEDCQGFRNSAAAVARTGKP
jgi:hypothetical protein